MSYWLYGCYGLTISVTVRQMADEDVTADDVFKYFLNLDTATFPSLTELEKDIKAHQKIEISNLK